MQKPSLVIWDLTKGYSILAIMIGELSLKKLKLMLNINKFDINSVITFVLILKGMLV